MNIFKPILTIFLIFLIIGIYNLKISASNTTNIQLAAVQMKLDLEYYWFQEEFYNKVEKIMKKIDAKTEEDIPTLVVFPEDTGLMLIAQNQKDNLRNVGTINSAIKNISLNSFFPILWSKIKTGLPWVPSIFYNFHKNIAETYFNTFSKMAEKYGVYIVGGSVILPEYKIEKGKPELDQTISNKIYNTSYLFNPEGKIIGKQEKIKLIDLEQEQALHLNQGKLENLQVFSTKIGKIGIAICLDAFNKEIIQKLQQQGAEILVQPSANPKTWSREQQQEWLQGSYHWTYSENKFKYAVNPMLVGSLWNINFKGQSSIITSHQSSPNNISYQDLSNTPGFLKIAVSDEKEEIIIVKVPHPQLKEK